MQTALHPPNAAKHRGALTGAAACAFPMASSPDAVLLALILDHCDKNGWHDAAASVRANAHDSGHSAPTLPSLYINGQTSFLAEWFGIFWNFFRVRASSTFSNPAAGAAAATANVTNPPNHQHPPHPLQHAPPQQHADRFRNAAPSGPAAAVAATAFAPQNGYPRPPLNAPRRGPRPHPHFLGSLDNSHEHVLAMQRAASTPSANVAAAAAAAVSRAPPPGAPTPPGSAPPRGATMRPRPTSSSPAAYMDVQQKHPGASPFVPRTTGETSQSNADAASLAQRRVMPANYNGGAKKRASSAGASMDSAQMAAASYKPGGANGPKKRMRAANPAPSGLPHDIDMMRGAMSSQLPTHQQHQQLLHARLHQQQQQDNFQRSMMDVPGNARNRQQYIAMQQRAHAQNARPQTKHLETNSQVRAMPMQHINKSEGMGNLLGMGANPSDGGTPASVGGTAAVPPGSIGHLDTSFFPMGPMAAAGAAPQQAGNQAARPQAQNYHKKGDRSPARVVASQAGVQQQHPTAAMFSASQANGMHGRKGEAAENMSTKSDRNASAGGGGGGTPSQRSHASGVSAAAQVASTEKRTTKATTRKRNARTGGRRKASQPASSPSARASRTTQHPTSAANAVNAATAPSSATPNAASDVANGGVNGGAAAAANATSAPQTRKSPKRTNKSAAADKGSSAPKKGRGKSAAKQHVSQKAVAPAAAPPPAAPPPPPPAATPQAKSAEANGKAAPIGTDELMNLDSSPFAAPNAGYHQLEMASFDVNENEFFANPMPTMTGMPAIDPVNLGLEPTPYSDDHNEY